MSTDLGRREDGSTDPAESWETKVETMSERTRHAAELAARLAIVANTIPYASRVPHGMERPTSIARDVDNLLRLSASLRGIGEHKRNGTMPKCLICDGQGECFNDDDGEVIDGYPCPECNATGEDTRREKRLIQAVTDTLKPYGLAWKPEPESGAVRIAFPDGANNSMEFAGWLV